MTIQRSRDQCARHLTGFSLTLGDFQPDQLMPCFCFQVVKKNLDYVRILRRNNWIVRSQKFRISDGWVQNLTTVPGIGQKCTKMVVSKIRQTGPNSDTSIWFSTPLFNIRTLSSHFEQYRPISDSIVSFGTTVKFLALPSRFRHNPSDF